MAAVAHESRQLAIHLNHAYKYGNFYLVFVECWLLKISPKKKQCSFLGIFLFVAKVMTITTRLILPNLAIN
jgi:hypothetical protein